MIAQGHASAPVRRSSLVVLIISLTVIVFLVIGTGVVQLGLFSQPQVENRSDWLQARFLAKSGVDAFAHWLMTNPDGLSQQAMDDQLRQIVDINGGKSNPIGMQDVQDGSFLVMVSWEDQALRVEGVGTYRNKKDTYVIWMEKDSSGQWNRKEVAQ